MEKNGGRLADGPLVGNGWAWALYKPDAPERNVATDFRKACLGWGCRRVRHRPRLAELDLSRIETIALPPASALE